MWCNARIRNDPCVATLEPTWGPQNAEITAIAPKRHSDRTLGKDARSDIIYELVRSTHEVLVQLEMGRVPVIAMLNANLGYVEDVSATCCHKQR